MRTPLASTPLCLPHENFKAAAGEFCFSTLVMLFILQAAIGLGNIAFFCFGLSYIDDNVREHNSPALIGNFYLIYKNVLSLILITTINIRNNYQ